MANPIYRQYIRTYIAATLRRSLASLARFFVDGTSTLSSSWYRRASVSGFAWRGTGGVPACQALSKGGVARPPHLPQDSRSSLAYDRRERLRNTKADMNHACFPFNNWTTSGDVCVSARMSLILSRRHIDACSSHLALHPGANPSSRFRFHYTVCCAHFIT
jgi:hypothetical protein